MDLNKTEHFLDFIFCNGLLQDAAYGTTKLNFFNGESQILPHAVITARYEHIISYYIKFCESKNFGMIIWDINRILKTLKPSHRKSVEGLDIRLEVWMVSLYWRKLLTIIWHGEKLSWRSWNKENVIWIKKSTLYVDFFLLRDNEGIIKKYTYFTAWFISNQDFQNTFVSCWLHALSFFWWFS